MRGTRLVKDDTDDDEIEAEIVADKRVALEIRSEMSYTDNMILPPEANAASVVSTPRRTTLNRPSERPTSPTKPFGDNKGNG